MPRLEAAERDAIEREEQAAADETARAEVEDEEAVQRAALEDDEARDAADEIEEPMGEATFGFGVADRAGQFERGGVGCPGVREVTGLESGNARGPEGPRLHPRHGSAMEIAPNRVESAFRLCPIALQIAGRSHQPAPQRQDLGEIGRHQPGVGVAAVTPEIAFVLGPELPQPRGE